ncbi:hypothetical protein EYC98_06375 [Halieaceae bacterium IMCC14734]|uniref:Uncharacterized protein n=1 Tax=Candidatus Litorirhabdus singularis TaxID=2518993 RepID=A0ABT3TE22_9GAMM|nr:hypothetical protein [Candidatus Litorirhabdus singularis]MCX2980499.1 hypothetical protein [Candidatus Litorirhabdus singularis]
MTVLKTAVTTALLAFSAIAFSAEPVAIDKVKTGLLSATETYSIYSVSCSDESTAAIAAMNRGTRWCVAEASQLDCFSDRENAAVKACSSTLMASNG